MSKPLRLHHFSEDPTIERFVPHVPRTNPTQPASVWAIDAEHAPLYWFPRDCPRVTVWPRTPDERDAFAAAWVTDAARVHAIEAGWLDRMRTCVLYRYDLDATVFEPWIDGSGDRVSGQWVAHTTVEPVAVEPVPVSPVAGSPVGDLLDAHVAAGIELRLVPGLWPLADLARSGPWEFSLVRMANAQPDTRPGAERCPR